MRRNPDISKSKHKLRNVRCSYYCQRICSHIVLRCKGNLCYLICHSKHKNTVTFGTKGTNCKGENCGNHQNHDLKR